MLPGEAVAAQSPPGPPADPPPNDDFADATAVSVGPFTDKKLTEKATLQSGEPQPSCSTTRKTVWYRITPSAAGELDVRTWGSDFDTVLGVYTGSSLNSLSQVACHDDESPTWLQSHASVTVALPGITYFIQAGGFVGASGTLRIAVDFLPVPPNDDFADAHAIDGMPLTQLLNTRLATVESGEPTSASCWNGTFGKSVWYRLESSVKQIVIADTLESSYGNVLVAYTGTSLQELQTVACTNSWAGSKVNFVAGAGATYYFQIADFWGTGGDLRFHVEGHLPLANDDFSNATSVSSSPFNDTADTSRATVEPGEPSACSGGSGSVWYRLTVENTAGVEVDTVGSNFDTVLVVYTGTSLQNLELVTCNNNYDYYGWPSRVRFRADPGVTYHIQARGRANYAGSLAFNLELFPPPSNDDIAQATLITGPLQYSSEVIRTMAATLEDGEVQPSCISPTQVGGTVWFRYQPTLPMRLRASTEWSDFDTVLAVYVRTPVGMLQVACNDDSFFFNGTSRVDFAATPGADYYFQAGGYAGRTGSLVFDLYDLRIL